MTKWLYKSMRYAALYPARKLAVNHLRSELGRGVSKAELLGSDSYSGCIYFSVSYGPTCTRLPRGKILVQIHDLKPEAFSMKELLKEIEISNINQPLFV